MIGIVTLAAALLGCNALEPPPTPHPALATLTDAPLWRFARGVELIDPRELQGFPVGQVEAVRRASAMMDAATADGPVVAWGARVTNRGVSRMGWIVMRGDPRDPELTGRDFGLEVALIDAVTGEPLELGVRPGLDVPPRLVVPSPGEVVVPP